MSKIYRCPISNNILEISVTGNNANFDHCNLDAKNIKAFFLLLVQCIAELQKCGVKTIQQLVTFADWDFLSNNQKWKIIQTNDITRCHIIQCDIENAIDSIANGFGIKNENI